VLLGVGGVWVFAQGDEEEQGGLGLRVV
jgi:hypothetical protein